MGELLDIFSAEWAIRALIASSLVGVMCGVIGAFIVLRNMSLIGDALSHAILPGIVVAFLIVGYSTIGFFVGSVLAGLIAAVGITWIQHNVKTKNDAAIGIVFTSMFSLGVIGISYISNRPGGGVHLDLGDFLFGTVLGISNEDIILTAITTVFTLISVIIFYRHLFVTTFQPVIAETMGISVKFIHYFLMLLLSFAVVSSLRTVGVILVVAMLITPASTAMLLTNKLKNVVILSGVFGLLAAVLGLLSAILLNTTPGPAMCIVATILYFIAAIFSPEKGLLFKYFNQLNQKKKIEQEDIIKLITKQKETQSISSQKIQEILGYSKSRVKSNISILIKDGLLQESKGEYRLTIKGNSNAQALVRAHRLWETYLVNKTGLNEGQIHPDAERLEHLLTAEMIDEVDQALGYPDSDPHGSPIPKKGHIPQHPLLRLKPRSRAKIAKNQISESIESELWELGLVANTTFQIENINANSVMIKVGQKSIPIPARLAQQINVVSS